MGRGAYGRSREIRQTTLANRARGLTNFQLNNAIEAEDRRARNWSETVPRRSTLTPQRRRNVSFRDRIFDDNMRALENEQTRRDQEDYARAQRRRQRRARQGSG